MQLTGYGFIRVQLWSGAAFDFLPVTCTVAVQHVASAADFPLTVYDQVGETVNHTVVVLRLVSGEILHVKSTKEVRAAFAMGTEPHYVSSERKALVIGNAS